MNPLEYGNLIKLSQTKSLYHVCFCTCCLSYYSSGTNLITFIYYNRNCLCILITHGNNCGILERPICGKLWKLDYFDSQSIIACTLFDNAYSSKLSIVDWLLMIIDPSVAVKLCLLPAAFIDYFWQSYKCSNIVYTLLLSSWITLVSQSMFVYQSLFLDHPGFSINLCFLD